MSILAKKRKHLEKRKKQQPKILNITMSSKEGPVFTFNLPRGATRPLASDQFRHCWQEVSTVVFHQTHRKDDLPEKKISRPVSDINKSQKYLCSCSSEDRAFSWLGWCSAPNLMSTDHPRSKHLGRFCDAGKFYQLKTTRLNDFASVTRFTAAFSESMDVKQSFT